LSLYRFARSVELESANQKEMVEGLLRTAPSEPLVALAVGEHHLERNNREEALQSFTQALAYRPEKVASALEILDRRKVPRSEALSVVPPNLEAGLAATRWLRSKGGNWREYAERLLTQNSADATKRKVEEAAAHGMLLHLVGRFDEAAATLAHVVEARPDRSDWRLELARVHLDRRDWQACERRLAEVIEKAPQSVQAKEAHQLLDRLSTSAGGGRSPHPAAAPSAN
jgi:thioredoxin-like negative regulator of GroEL